MDVKWTEALGDSKLVGLVTSRGIMAGSCIKHLGSTADGRSIDDRLSELRRLRILCDSSIQSLIDEAQAAATNTRLCPLRQEDAGSYGIKS
jgi:hypothetical protein